MSVRLTVLETVLNADRPLTTTEIDYLIPGPSRRTINTYLKLLVDQGLLVRDRDDMPMGGYEYVYQSANASAFDEPDSGWPEAEQRQWNAAIARARPHWRKGERFSREEVARFREEQRRRMDWVMGRTR